MKIEQYFFAILSMTGLLNAFLTRVSLVAQQRNSMLDYNSYNLYVSSGLEQKRNFLVVKAGLQSPPASQSWTNNLQISLTGVAIENFNSLRGVVATNDIDDKTVSVTLSSKATIETINNRPPSPFPDFCPQSVWEESLWDMRLAFMLMYEKFILKESSSKIDWINELPQAFSTPLHWNDDNLSQLHYDEIVTRIKKQRQDWLALYQKWMSTAAPSSIAKRITYNDFEWALQCTNSRAFSGVYEGSTFAERKALILFTLVLAALWPVVGLGSAEQAATAAFLVAFSIFAKDFFSSRISGLKRYVICPFVDMINHKSDCFSDVSYNYFSGNLELRTQAYRKGEQVFISYGKQSNDRLLQYYGFVEPNNPIDSYDFSKNILELLLLHGDTLSSVGLLPSNPTPKTRLAVIAQVLRGTPVQEPGVLGRRSRELQAVDVHVKCSRATAATTATAGGADKALTGTAAVQTILAEANTRRQSDEEGLSAVGQGTNIISKFDDVTVRTLRAMLCSSDEWLALSPPGGELFSLERLAMPMSSSTELRVADTIRTLVRIELDSKPTSLEEDRVLLSSLIAKQDVVISADPSGYYSNTLLAAVAFRIEKKTLLRQAFSS